MQKAIEDKNYISFTYDDQNNRNIKPLRLDENNRLFCDKGIFEFEKISKLKILKDRF